MRVIDKIRSGRTCLSFEVFPPKTSDKFDSVKEATEQIAALKPDFMSVTYGAGGGTSEFTLNIAQNIEKKFGVPALAHLTCVSSTKEQVKAQIEKLKADGIENILALRGDIPQDFDRSKMEFHHASELIECIRQYGDFCIGGACYPEGHTECETLAKDIEHLKLKEEAGCSFFTTQMFFDNNILYSFLYKIRDAGITVPIVAGIMPVTNANQIKRITNLSGTFVPARFRAIVERFGNDPKAMKQAGIAYATEQIIDLLANGVNAVHIYSMNKPDVAAKIKENLSDILAQA